MKVLVPIKRVIDAYVKIRVKSDESAVETQNVKMAMNPFDEIAIEEAIRLKEQGVVSDIVVVSIGDAKTVETLRQALALGADKAIHIHSEQPLEPLTVAKCLQKITEQQQPDFIIMGKQAIDGDHSQTGVMLAGLLSWSQATFASHITMDTNAATVTREIDGGLETIKSQLPCVITTDLRLNEPRYASLPNIMKAKRKPLETLALDSLGVDITRRHTTRLKVSAPSERSAGVMVDSTQELLDKLRNEARVIA